MDPLQLKVWRPARSPRLLRPVLIFGRPRGRPHSPGNKDKKAPQPQFCRLWGQLELERVFYGTSGGERTLLCPTSPPL